MTAIRTNKTGKAEYEQLSSARVTKSKNIVVSKCSKGGFTIAQQLVVNDDQNEVSVFLKGAYHIRNIDALISLRDAIDEAINKSVKSDEGNVEDDYDWDE